jgi:hypothetical protein
MVMDRPGPPGPDSVLHRLSSSLNRKDKKGTKDRKGSEGIEAAARRA